MVELHPKLDREHVGCSWSALKDLTQLVGSDDARNIYAKLSEIANASANASEPMPMIPTDEPDQAPNEVYILALSAALQRASEEQPSCVEYRVRQVLRRLGMRLEACQSYFIPPQSPLAHVYDGFGEDSP